MPGDENSNVNQEDSSKNQEQNNNNNSQHINPEEFQAIKQELETLKNFHKDFIKEQKQKTTKAKEEVDRIAREKAESEGNWKEVLEITKKQFQEKLDAYEAKLSKAESERNDRTLSDAARDMATEMTGHPGKQKQLAKIIKESLKMTEDGIKVVDQDGNLTTTDLESLKTKIRNDYDWMVDAVQSGGSGAKGNINSTTVRNLKDMSEAEVLKLFRENPDKYRELKRQQTK